MSRSEEQGLDFINNTENSSFQTHSPNEYKTDSILKPLILTVKAFLGIGALGLPYFVSQVGLLLGLCIISCCSFSVWYSLKNLLFVADSKNWDEKNIENLYLSELGHAARWMVFGLNALINLAILILYSILFATTCEQIFCELFGETLFCFHFSVYLIFPYLVVIGLIIFVQKMIFFSYPALVATALFGLILFELIAYSIVSIIKENIAIIENDTFDPSLIVSCIVGCLYAHEGIMIVIPARNTMTSPKQYTKILDYTFIITVTFYVIVTAFVVLANGEETEEIAYLNYDDEIPVFIVIVLFIVVLGFYKPFFFFAVSNFTDELVEKNDKKFIKSNLQKIQFLVKLAILLFCFTVAAVIGSFSYFIELVGATCFPLGVLVLPNWLYLKAISKEFQDFPKSRKIIGPLIMIIVGISVITLYLMTIIFYQS